MLTQPHEVVRALQRYRDCYDPRSTSVLELGGASDPHAEPFRRTFITHFEERAELLSRLNVLPERERLLLVLWHVEGRPVTEIARTLGVSRVHCYRLNRRALALMVSGEQRDDIASDIDAAVAIASA